MLARLYAFGCISLSLIVPAVAQQARVSSDPATQTLENGKYAPLTVDLNGRLWLANPSSGGGGVASTVQANQGTAGTAPWPVQGFAGGVPLNSFAGQFNTALPTLASGATGYLAVDSNGRLIQSPGASVSVSNFPASQAVTGAFFQATQPISATALPLPAGAATAANQTSWQGSATAGASATLAGLAAGRYNATAPALTDGQQAALQLDASGNLKVTGIPGGSAGATDATVSIPISATGTTTGFRVDGYGSLFAEFPTGTATFTLQGSSDSTNGVDGTWTTVTGFIPEDQGASIPTSSMSATTKRRLFRAQDTGGWVRVNTSAFTTAGNLYITKRVAPVAERGVFVGNNVATTQSAASGIGGIAVATGVSRLPSSAATTNLTQIKSSQGRVYKIVACNTTTTPVRIKFYNATSATVTVGTTAVVLVRPIPAAATAGGLACATYDQADLGWYFSTAISYALVTGATDADATAAAAGAITDLSVEFQ